MIGKTIRNNNKIIPHVTFKKKKGNSFRKSWKNKERRKDRGRWSCCVRTELEMDQTGDSISYKVLAVICMKDNERLLKDVMGNDVGPVML